MGQHPEAPVGNPDRGLTLSPTDRATGALGAERERTAAQLVAERRPEMCPTRHRQII